MTDACCFANRKPNSKFLFAGDCPTLIQPLNRKGNYFDLEQISDIIVSVCVCFPRRQHILKQASVLPPRAIYDQWGHKSTCRKRKMHGAVIIGLPRVRADLVSSLVNTSLRLVTYDKSSIFFICISCFYCLQSVSTRTKEKIL